MEKGKEQIIGETADISRQLIETSITGALVAQEIFAEIESQLNVYIEYVEKIRQEAEKNGLFSYAVEKSCEIGGLSLARTAIRILKQKYGIE